MGGHQTDAGGNSLVVQWLELSAFTAEGPVQSLVGALRSLKPCCKAKKTKTKTKQSKTKNRGRAKKPQKHKLRGGVTGLKGRYQMTGGWVPGENASCFR